MSNLDKITLAQIEKEMAKGLPQKDAINNLAMKETKKDK